MSNRNGYPSTLPSQIVERIKNIDNVYKSNLKLTPVSKSAINAGERAEIFFPMDERKKTIKAKKESDQDGGACQLRKFWHLGHARGST